jgi:NADPH:quinone reductase-like Zn-dependent oxidoreductase
MKTMTLVATGNAEKAFEEREAPIPIPGKEEVLIKVEAFGLNFADVLARQGLYKEAPPIPCVPGYEVVGVVTEVGEKVSKDWVGKRVTAFTRFGGYAEYATTNPNGMVEIGEMDAGKACALATQYSTAWYMVCIRGYFREGDAVLVHSAAGGVGTALTQLLKAQGCIVFGTTSTQSKFVYMRENGVDHPVLLATYVQEIPKITDQRIIASFNAIGGKSYKKDYKLLAPGGTIYQFGAADRSGKKGGIFSSLGLLFGMGFTHPLFLLMQSKSIVGVNMLTIGDHQPNTLNECMNGAVQWAKEGKLNPIVGNAYSVSELAQAHAELESGKSKGKIVVKW